MPTKLTRSRWERWSKAIRAVVGRCENPGGCDGSHFPYDLEVCHILSRGMGGGGRDDSVENLVVLCGFHHYAFDAGKRRARREWMHLKMERTEETWRELRRLQSSSPWLSVFS